MPYGDDPWIEQARAAASMPAMQQTAGYPYQPYTQVAPGFGGYSAGHAAADVLGGVMNAWISKQVNKHQELQQRAQSVFQLQKLGYDLGTLLDDPQNRAAVEKTLNIKLPKNLTTGGYGPAKSSQQLEEEAKRELYKANASNAPQVAQQTGIGAPTPPQQANWMPPQQATTEAQYYGQQLPSPVSADVYQQQPTPAAPAMQPQAQAQQAQDPWQKLMSDPRVATMVASNPELAAKLKATQMTVEGGLKEAQQRALGQMAVARLEATQKGMEFVANMRMQGIKDLGLTKEASDNLTVSLIDPSVPLTEGTQKAIDQTLSTTQRQRHEQVMNWLKDAYPSMTPDQANAMSIAVAKGYRVDPSWFPPGSENMLARMKATELAIKQVEQQKGAWDVGEKVELTVEGKKVTMPMYLANKAADISKTMAEYDLLRRRVPNIDAIAQMLKSESVVSKQAKTELIKKVMRDMNLTPTDQKSVWDYIDIFGLRTPPVGVQPQQPTPAAPSKAKEALDRLAR